MSLDTLDRALDRLDRAERLDEAERAELRALLARLRDELHAVEGDAATADHARTLAGFTELSAHEATQAQRDETVLRIATDGMRASVERFEQRHPELVDLINQIATALSRMGI